MDENFIHLKKIAKGAGIVLVGLLLGKIFASIFSIIAARIGPSQYGIFSLGTTIIDFFIIISLFGMHEGVIRYVSFYLGKKDMPRVKSAITMSIKYSMIASFVMSILLFFLAPIISVKLFNKPELIPILRILIIALPFSVLARIFIYSLRAFHKVKEQIISEEIIFKSLKVMFLIALFAIIGVNIYGVIFSQIAGAIVFFVLSFILLEKTFPIINTKVRGIDYSQELIGYSLPLAFFGMINSFLAWTDILVLGHFNSSADVGIYSIAHLAASMMLLVPFSLLNIFLPIITEVYVTKKDEFKKIYFIVSRWIFLATFPVFLIMVLFSRQLLSILFGQEYGAGAVSLSILALGYLCYGLSQTSINTLNMVKKTKSVLYISIITLFLNVLLNYLLIPLYGMNGSAIATTISFLIGSVAAIFFSRKYLNLVPFRKEHLKLFIAGILALIISYFVLEILRKLSTMLILNIAIIFVVFFSIYVLLLLLFKSFEQEDKEMFKLIKRKIGFH